MRLLRWADAVNGYVSNVKGDEATSTVVNDLIADFRATASAVYYGYLHQNQVTELSSYPNTVRRFLDRVDVGPPAGGANYLATLDLGEGMLRCQQLLEGIKAELASN